MKQNNTKAYSSKCMITLQLIIISSFFYGALDIHLYALFIQLEVCTTTFHFLFSLLNIKYILLTIGFNKMRSPCKICFLKELDNFMTITLKRGRPSLIKFSNILTVCCKLIRM